MGTDLHAKEDDSSTQVAGSHVVEPPQVEVDWHFAGLCTLGRLKRPTQDSITTSMQSLHMHTCYQLPTV